MRWRDIKQHHERAVIEKFAAWHNEQHGTDWRYVGRPDADRPDGILRDGGREFGVEVGNGYYDEREAELKWTCVRTNETKGMWSGVNSDEALADSLTLIIEKKKSKNYPQGTMLVMFVRPPITSISDMERVVPRIAVPGEHPFSAVFLIGDFPDSASMSASEAGGLVGWKLA
jgi:hypothetical protein